MNYDKIEKLRKKFIMVTSLSFFMVMLMMGGLMYLTSLTTTLSEVHEVMNFIIENDGNLILRHYTDTANDLIQGAEDAQTAADQDTSVEIGVYVSAENQSELLQQIEQIKRLFTTGNWIYNSEEFTYSTRYFAVLFDEEMNVSEIKTSHIASVSQEEAEQYACLALERPLKFGTYNGYYYQVADRINGGTIVVFLESLRQMDATNRLLYSALVLIGLGSIATLFLVRMLSHRIVRSEMESAAMQERFITNASHELKTPLAVIKANTEVEQMLNGENEWNQSTMRQVERMTGLIQNLIRIVRAEEKENSEPLQKLDVSAIIKETVDTYEPVASQEGKHLAAMLDNSQQFIIREADIRQLVSLLLDNAIKYCDEDGSILVALKGKGRTLKLIVSNSYAEGENTDYSRFFERFYRKDESHNVEKGGYGIGLSIAESLVKKYKGMIDVDWKNGMIHFTCTMYTPFRHTEEGPSTTEK